MIIEAVWGQRVAAKVELEGLDIPEMGALGYPEFVLKAEPVGAEIGQQIMSTALVVNTTTRLQPRGCRRCRRFPGETRMTVSPAELAAYIQKLEQACLEQPAVGGPADVPRAWRTR